MDTTQLPHDSAAKVLFIHPREIKIYAHTHTRTQNQRRMDGWVGMLDDR